MAKIHKFRFSPSRSVDLVDRAVGEALEHGVVMRRSGRYEGGRVEVEGRKLLNFGSCSYMGLELRNELREAAISATCEYGTQFSFSRAYLESPLYRDLESNLEIMTGRPVLVAPSTTLAHIAALPVLVRDNDVVLIDQFAHASLHTATEMLREVPVRIVRHSRIEQLEELLTELSPKYERIWLIIDGLYSMLGDFAPFDDLKLLLERFPQLHLYIDDAHATSWLGKNGRGGALMHLGDQDRVVVALSLNKAFSCAGGALAVCDQALKMRLRRCGGPMLFSGPIQPPMLGAAVACSRLHLTSEHARLQDELLSRLSYAMIAAESIGLPLATRHRTPIFFIPQDSAREAYDAVHEFWNRGFYVCPSAFPSVPINKPGIRFTIGLHNEPKHIEAFMSVAEEICALKTRIETASPVN